MLRKRRADNTSFEGRKQRWRDQLWVVRLLSCARALQLSSLHPERIRNFAARNPKSADALFVQPRPTKAPQSICSNYPVM